MLVSPYEKKFHRVKLQAADQGKAGGGPLFWRSGRLSLSYRCFI
jgi:hypothetical protein